jgi:hypothetical protein
VQTAQIRSPIGCCIALVAVLAQVFPCGAAQSARTPRLETNQAYIEEAVSISTLDIADAMAVFGFVLDSLPDRVIVYPTENYYYFSFIDNGVRFAGNIRIEIKDAGGPIVHFTYYEDTSEWREDTPENHVILEQSRGVAVEQLERLTYRISYKGKSVLFVLNDLSAVKPPAGAIAPSEKFIGPVFDESAVRFFLIFNAKLKIFHFVLDETVSVADQFFSPPATDRILIGKRTGFAFYRDHLRDRKILIGAQENNMRVNNYFDGPFDQLPDNFIEGEALREAILAVEPQLKGKIDRFGSDPSGEVRFSIDPYLPYQKIEDLYRIHRCAVAKQRTQSYYTCFSRELGGMPVGDQNAAAGRKAKARKRR